MTDKMRAEFEAWADFALNAVDEATRQIAYAAWQAAHKEYALPEDYIGIPAAAWHEQVAYEAECMALREKAARALPDGWVAVPVVPTTKQLEAIGEAALIHNEWGVDPYVENPDEVYTAMVAARPEGE